MQYTVDWQCKVANSTVYILSFGKDKPEKSAHFSYCCVFQSDVNQSEKIIQLVTRLHSCNQGQTNMVVRRTHQSLVIHRCYSQSQLVTCGVSRTAAGEWIHVSFLQADTMLHLFFLYWNWTFYDFFLHLSLLRSLQPHLPAFMNYSGLEITEMCRAASYEELRTCSWIPARSPSSSAGPAEGIRSTMDYQQNGERGSLCFIRMNINPELNPLTCLCSQGHGHWYVNT